MRRRLALATVALTVLLSSSFVALLATAAPANAAPVVSPPALVRPSTGYWLVGGDGGIFNFGESEFHGSTGDIKLAKPIVGIGTPPSGKGYWLVASDGGVFAFGDVAFHGSTGAQRLNRPIVAMASTPTGNGYWLVASDGGIFTFGDAPFFGSTGDLVLNQPIVSMSPTPTGRGYWLVARDGGVFAFGDAGFFGSTGDSKLNSPIVTVAATPSGQGYWMAAGDGGIFAFGDAGFFGSTGSLKLNKPIVGMAATGLGEGYWLVASDGGIFSFGDAGFYGSAGSLQLTSPVIAMAPRAKASRVGSSIFFYPWYGNPSADSGWKHWDHNGHQPPDDLAANFYPARGPYSSSLAAILDAQMAEIVSAGVGTVVTSWWGPKSFEDDVLAAVVAAARAKNLRVAIHMEPYAGRTPDTVQRDVLSLRSRFGIDEYWIYLSDGPTADNWTALTSRFPELTFWAHGHSPANGVNGLFAAYAARAGFDGVYTYDPVRYSFGDFSRFCRQARSRGLRCSPSVSPGYDGRRGVPDSTVRSREGGTRYDDSWIGAFASGADLISITSYNEWHEGTQIEPARAGVCITNFCYSSYEAAFGLTGSPAESSYLDRTRFWTDALRL